MAHCSTCTCPPPAALHQMVGNVSWEMTSSGVRGPLCNSLGCRGELHLRKANGTQRKARANDVVGHNVAHLVCIACGSEHLLGHEPRDIAGVRAEAEALHASYAAKGVFA